MDGSKAFPERLGDPAPTTSPVPSPPPSPRLSMGVLRNIVIGVIAISFLTFVALFGQLPALRKTPIGWLQRLLCLHIPNGLRAADRVATGGKITLRSKRLGRYLFYEKNPVVLVRDCKRVLCGLWTDLSIDFSSWPCSLGARCYSSGTHSQNYQLD